MNRTPVCYGYGRHSTNKQELTKEVQQFRTKEHWDRNLREKGIAWGGFLYDPATSARTPFSERPSGRILHAVAQPGDHIVVTKLDRPFRSLRDGVTAMDQWQERGVIFHALDLQVDTGTAMGRFFRSILLAVAELEREFAKERTRETVLLRQRQGLPYSSNGCPVGWRIVGKAPHRRFRVDEDERLLVGEMARLRSDGATLEELALWSMRQKQVESKRTFPTRGQVKWALSARLAGWPKISNYKTFNRRVASGEIALSSS
jgi:DNA invertase Pin-like site-specific DNA recombinase